MSIAKYHRILLSLTPLFKLLFIKLLKIYKKLEITLVGIGLFIGLVLSWIIGLSGGDVFIWIFCLYFGLQVGQLIFSEDSNDDDDDFGGGILTPVFKGN